ncbi:hypothetical protein PFISCL1PPCAC_4962, partial [Pristionchus fissidentatus]
PLSPRSRGALPSGGRIPVDFRGAIVPQPRINRVLANIADGKHRFSGSCPFCKEGKTGEWNGIKEHVQWCRRLRQHPLLMRTSYCPYCLKRCADHYALSSHIQHHHISLIRFLKRECNGHRLIDEVGVHTSAMRKETFPFVCSKCNVCWPTASAIAAHFVRMEKRDQACGGTVVVHINSSRETSKGEDSITHRYDFALPIVCSYCPEVFTEAYTLSNHMSDKHKQTMRKLEKRLSPHIKAFPKKKLFYEPFLCSMCHCTFKSMSQWAEHIHASVHSGQVCYGDVRVVKYFKEECIFKSNVVATLKSNADDDPNQIDESAPPENQTRKLTFDGTYSKEIKAEYMGMTIEAFESELQKEIKYEPIDNDESMITEHWINKPNETPICSLEHDYISPYLRARMDGEKEHIDQLRAPCVHPMTAVVKEEPTDDYCNSQQEGAASAAPAAGQAVVKEEPLDESMEEPQQPIGTDKGVVKGEPKDECKKEEDEYDCDECRMSFPNERTFIVHMRSHGYELADPYEAKRIDAGENIAGPSPKKPKTEEATSCASLLPSGTSGRRYPELPGNEDEEDYYVCPSCNSISLTAAECSTHLRRCYVHLNSINRYECSVCKKRRFETMEKLAEHENDCRYVKAVEAREKSFQAPTHCPFCYKRTTNAFVLSSHLSSEHSDIIKRLRFHHLTASEFLPFRCSACHVGFEDARLLLDHFRLREEFGKGCSGCLVVHDYQLSLRALEQLKRALPIVSIPDIPELDDMDYDIYADIYKDEYCPCDSPAPLRMDSTLLRRCLQCTEIWPIVQMKWHIKMDHPQFYFANASFKCKKCKQFHFFCPAHYADHYENCIVDNWDEPANDKLLPVITRTFASEKPSMERGVDIGGVGKYSSGPLKAIPENIGNEMRPCRFCKQYFSPEGLLLHQKNEHSLEHFTDAPYHCGRCDDVGFYSHQEFKHHGTRCTGETPVHLHNNLYAITSKEVEMRTGTKRVEIPSYHAIISAERRAHGTFASFNRAHNCPICNHWCTSLLTMTEHLKDAHSRHLETIQPFLCGGCGILFADAEDLKKHLRNQEILGNAQCFDTATTNAKNYPKDIVVPIMNTTRFVKAPPLICPRTSGTRPLQGTSPVVSNWRKELGLDVRPQQKQKGLLRMTSSWSLSRQQAAFKRHPQTLLPIRPMSQLSKSPLSAERHQLPQQLQKQLASRYRPQNLSYYKQ